MAVTRMLKRLLLVPVLLLVAAVQLSTVLPALAQTQTGPTFPPLTGRVVDAANILPADMRTSLTEKLQALQDKTTTQLVVVTLPSLQGYEIADYGYQLGRAWGIGQKGSNNGALLIVAPSERKVRIEVGYGLEGTLTDAVSRLIIENAILPRFRAGDFPGGIQRGTDDLIQVLSGDADEFKKRAAEQTSEEPHEIDWITFVVIIVILIIFLRMFFRGPGGPSVGRRGGFAPPIFFPSGGGRGGGFGGGFGGGGGFSGGGGSFGGGGASGSW
jgi:uncharacterized protein